MYFFSFLDAIKLKFFFGRCCEYKIICFCFKDFRQQSPRVSYTSVDERVKARSKIITLKMTTAQVVETSGTVNNNSPIKIRTTFTRTITLNLLLRLSCIALNDSAYGLPKKRWSRSVLFSVNTSRNPI